MTVLSAGIVTRQGKILLSRQFVDISRIRIEGLLSAFPKLIGSSSHSNGSSTFLETGGVRYVYQPIESFYLVLVTTRTSNIIEDLSTLRMMGSLISVHVDEISEERIAANAFEILFSFDEVIVNGEREDNTMQDVMLYLEMRSEAEEQAKEEKKKQEELAAKEARRREREITAKRREMGFGGVGSHNQGGGHMGSGGGRGGYMDDEDEAPAKRYGGDDGANRFASVVKEDTKKPLKTKAAGGMSLSKARKTDVSHKVLQEAAPKAMPSAPAATAALESVGASSNDGIQLRIEETISATLHRDGGTSSVDLRGDLFINVSDAQLANIRLLLGRLNESDFTFRTHPNINKPVFQSDRILCIKDNKPFPVHQSLGILKWRLNSGNMQLKAPLAVTCWPADNTATIEFELTQKNGLVLQQVVLLIPTQGFALESSEASCGSVETTEDGAGVQWTINNVDSSNATGSLELTLAGNATEDVFFPMQVGFVAQRPSVAGVTVTEVVGCDNGMPVRFSSESVLSAEDYLIN